MVPRHALNRRLLGLIKDLDILRWDKCLAAAGNRTTFGRLSNTDLDFWLIYPGSQLSENQRECLHNFEIILTFSKQLPNRSMKHPAIISKVFSESSTQGYKMCRACRFILTVWRLRRAFISDCEELILRLSHDCQWHTIRNKTATCFKI
jgi:hypothetical protein